MLQTYSAIHSSTRFQTEFATNLLLQLTVRNCLLSAASPKHMDMTYHHHLLLMLSDFRNLRANKYQVSRDLTSLKSHIGRDWNCVNCNKQSSNSSLNLPSLWGILAYQRKKLMATSANLLMVQWCTMEHLKASFLFCHPLPILGVGVCLSMYIRVQTCANVWTRLIGSQAFPWKTFPWNP